MLGKPHVGCGGTWHVARGITELDEAHANEHEDAAILRCDKCKLVITDDSTSSRPDRYRKARVPDQSVFEVEVKK